VRKRCWLGKDVGVVKELWVQARVSSQVLGGGEREDVLTMPCPQERWACGVFHVRERSLCPAEFPTARNFQGLIFHREVPTLTQ